MNISFVVGLSRHSAYSLNKYILMITRVLRDLKEEIASNEKAVNFQRALFILWTWITIRFTNK